MPPPEFGATAWGRAWLRTVERTGAMPHRQLPRARTLARHQGTPPAVSLGRVTAAVGDGSSTHQVSMHVRPWNAVEARAARPALELGRTPSAVGDLPDILAETLMKAGAPIAVPLDEVTATCTCRARTQLCAHILAALYELVLLVDERPLTALELRSGDLASTPGGDENWIALAMIRVDGFYARTA